MSLDALERAIDELGATDPSTCASAESIVRLQKLCTKLDAFATRSLAVFDASGEWSLDGARGVGPWLATTCHLPKAQARHMVRRSRMLRLLPECAEAWSEGAI
ncbi:MAG TPA: hypothetical protein VNG12_22870, partial [Acidimicrobiales bacterium]|nr:hypothetical protein [Acidimicrobiales bacterium]